MPEKKIANKQLTSTATCTFFSGELKGKVKCENILSLTTNNWLDHLKYRSSQSFVPSTAEKKDSVLH